jgi:hypothetical protein
MADFPVCDANSNTPYIEVRQDDTGLFSWAIEVVIIPLSIDIHYPTEDLL